jgi:hypothetical protein
MVTVSVPAFIKDPVTGDVEKVGMVMSFLNVLLTLPTLPASSVEYTVTTTSPPSAMRLQPVPSRLLIVVVPLEYDAGE